MASDDDDDDSLSQSSDSSGNAEAEPTPAAADLAAQVPNGTSPFDGAFAAFNIGRH